MVKKVGEKQTPLGEKETPLGEKVTKVGEKVNFVGEKKIHRPSLPPRDPWQHATLFQNNKFISAGTIILHIHGNPSLDKVP